MLFRSADGLISKRQGQASFICPINDTGQTTEVLNLGCLNQPGVLLTDYCSIFAHRLQELSSGKVEVKIHHSSSLGDGNKQIASVRGGEQDMFCAAIEWLANIDPAWEIATYPFMFSDIDHLKKVANRSEEQDLRDSLTKSHGMRIIAFNWYRPSRLIISKKPCLQEDDIKGMRIGIPAIKLYHDMWSSLGAIPVEVSFGERKKAFEEGSIDATDLNWDIILSEELYSVVKYATLTNHLYSRACIVMNEEKFQSFRPDTQVAIEQAARETGILYSKHLFDSFKKDKKTLMAHNMRFIEGNFAGWHHIAEDLAKKNIEAKKINMDLYSCIKETQV